MGKRTIPRHIHVHAERLITGWMIPAESGPTVYRHVAADGQVLYVGCSRNLADRTRGHKKSPWFMEIRTIVWERHETMLQAHKAEVAEIRRLDPPHNVAHTSREPFYIRRPNTAQRRMQELDAAARAVDAGHYSPFASLVQIMRAAVG